jgi:hypothetical protein
MHAIKLEKLLLEDFYLRQKKSVSDIAGQINCSEHKVNYWMQKHGIKKRSQSDAMFVKNHPNDDGFLIKKKLTNRETFLKGLGIGLYWGEGHKKSLNSVRLGNTDPKLTRVFMEFLTQICGVPRENITFSLTIFSDINPTEAKQFWVQNLEIIPEQIRGKITVIQSGKIGNYRQKSKYGVIIVQYHNKKLRDTLLAMLEDVKTT